MSVFEKWLQNSEIGICRDQESDCLLYQMQKIVGSCWSLRWRKANAATPFKSTLLEPLLPLIQFNCHMSCVEKVWAIGSAMIRMLCLHLKNRIGSKVPNVVPGLDACCLRAQESFRKVCNGATRPFTKLSVAAADVSIECFCQITWIEHTHAPQRRETVNMEW